MLYYTIITILYYTILYLTLLYYTNTRGPGRPHASRRSGPAAAADELLPRLRLLLARAAGVLRYGMVWYSMVWYGIVWYSMV